MLEQYQAAIDEIVNQVETNLVDPALFQRCWLNDIDFKNGRGECDRAFGKILGVTESTVRDWGSAPAYPKMPKNHRRNLTHSHQRMAAVYPDLC